MASAAKERIPDLIVSKAAALITADTGHAPEYVAVVDAETLETVTSLERPAVLAAAVKIGETRLIDNLRLEPAHAKI